MPADFEGTRKLVRELKDKKLAPAALEKLTALVGDKALEGVLVQVCALPARESMTVLSTADPSTPNQSISFVWIAVLFLFF